jgi:hypothetical protein
MLSQNKFLLKIIEHITNCWTYTIQFCLGKGYAKFSCWECESALSVTEHQRFIKCQKCLHWNVHPIWGERGKDISSFLKKIYLPSLLVLSLLIVVMVTIGWMVSVYIDI